MACKTKPAGEANRFSGTTCDILKRVREENKTKQNETKQNIMKDVHFICNKKVFVSEADALVECEVISQSYNFVENKQSLTVRMPDGTEKTIVGKDVKIYASADKDELEYQRRTFSQIVLKNEYGRPIRINEVMSEDESFYPIWIHDGVNAKREDLVLTDVTLVHAEPLSYTFNKSVPEVFFATGEDADDYSTYVVREQDGTERVVEGNMVKLLLSDDKKRAVQKFLDAITDLRNAGVQPIFDTYDYELMFFPDDIEFESTYDGCEDDEWKRANFEHAMRVNNHGIYAYCFEDSYLVRRKPSAQRQ